MRKIKDVLRLKLTAKLSHRQIGAALGISKGVVTKYVGLAASAGLVWGQVQDLDETALERLLLVGPERPRDQYASANPHIDKHRLAFPSESKVDDFSQ